MNHRPVVSNPRRSADRILCAAARQNDHEGRYFVRGHRALGPPDCSGSYLPSELGGSALGPRTLGVVSRRSRKRTRPPRWFTYAREPLPRPSRRPSVPVRSQTSKTFPGRKTRDHPGLHESHRASTSGRPSRARSAAVNDVTHQPKNHVTSACHAQANVCRRALAA